MPRNLHRFRITIYTGLGSWYPSPCALQGGGSQVQPCILGLLSSYGLYLSIPSCELQLRWLVLIEQNHLNTNVLSAICHTASTKAHIVVIASKEFVLVPQNAELNRVFTKQRSLFQILDLSWVLDLIPSFCKEFKLSSYWTFPCWEQANNGCLSPIHAPPLFLPQLNISNIVVKVEAQQIAWAQLPWLQKG